MATLSTQDSNNDLAIGTKVKTSIQKTINTLNDRGHEIVDGACMIDTYGDREAIYLVLLCRTKNSSTEYTSHACYGRIGSSLRSLDPRVTSTYGRACDSFNSLIKKKLGAKASDYKMTNFFSQFLNPSNRSSLDKIHDRIESFYNQNVKPAKTLLCQPSYIEIIPKESSSVVLILDGTKMSIFDMNDKSKTVGDIDVTLSESLAAMMVNKDGDENSFAIYGHIVRLDNAPDIIFISRLVQMNNMLVHSKYPDIKDARLLTEIVFEKIHAKGYIFSRTDVIEASHVDYIPKDNSFFLVYYAERNFRGGLLCPDY